MKVLIEIKCDNEAFGDEPGFEIERILRNLAYGFGHYEANDSNEPIYDLNGNKVGFLRIENDKD